MLALFLTAYNLTEVLENARLQHNLDLTYVRSCRKPNNECFHLNSSKVALDHPNMTESIF